MRGTLIVATALLGALLAPAGAQTIALTNARIHTMTGAPIERGTALAEHGVHCDRVTVHHLGVALAAEIDDNALARNQ